MADSSAWHEYRIYVAQQGCRGGGKGPSVRVVIYDDGEGVVVVVVAVVVVEEASALLTT